MKKIINKNFYQILWVFIIGSIFGSVYEVILNFIKHSVLESRSALVFGQFNPIYGFGAVFFVLILKEIKDNKKIVLYGALIGMIFEFFCSLIQEKLFGTISWDYSGYILNFNGRTSIFHGICWGLIGLGFIRLLCPLIYKIPNYFNKQNNNFITWFVISFLLLDMVISVFAGIRQKERIKQIEPSNKFEEVIDKIFSDSYMNSVYPNKMIKDFDR